MTATSAPITFSAGEVSTYYSARVPDLKQLGAEWRGPCPVHSGKGDNFAVEAATGNAYCFSSCSEGWDMIGVEMALSGTDFKTARAEVFRLVGRAEPDYRHSGSGSHKNGNGNSAGARREVARYPYCDQAGNLLFEVVRYLKPGGEKAFLQCRPDGHGAVIWNLDGVERVPYHLPELLSDPKRAVFLPEGERDVHTLEGWGLVASCNPGGSGGGHLYARWTGYFRGLHIIIPFDNDDPGRKHALEKAEILLNVAASVRIVELPGLGPRGDVTDWRDAGHTSDDFRLAVLEAPVIDAAALSELRVRWGLTDVKPHHHGSSATTDEQTDDQTHEERHQALAESAQADDWPKPESIQSELPPVEAFSEDLLPESFRPLVSDVTERMQVPMDFPAVVTMLCLAGAVNRRADIQPKVKDSSWVVVPNLWGGIIAPPGLMKSPVIQATARPLNQIQAEWHREHKEVLKEYALEKQKHELRVAAWRDQYKAATKKGGMEPERPEDEPEEPKLRRLIVNDATAEALQVIMSENPAGILVIRDELTGWLSQLDRQGREGERAFCLSAWNGNTEHGVDRIGRGNVHAEACCMSLLGGIQPGRLRSYLADALKDGPANDGLIQRFQLLVWPDRVRDRKYVDRALDLASADRVSRVFRKLVELDAENPLRFRFAPDAQELFIEWLTQLEEEINGDELHPALISHLSKYRSLMPSLALLFELADRAAGGFVSSNLGDLQNFQVSLEHAQQAAAWCEYLESHARRIYSCVVRPQLRAARELADKIRKRKVGSDGFFACRDVYRMGWEGLDSPESVKQALEIIEDAAWVRPAFTESGPSGGRPVVNRYQINPKVYE